VRTASLPIGCPSICRAASRHHERNGRALVALSLLFALGYGCEPLKRLAASQWGAQVHRYRGGLFNAICTVPGTLTTTIRPILRTVDLAEAIPAGWASGEACLACRPAVESYYVARFSRAAQLEAVARR